MSTLDLYPTLLSAAGATPTRWEHSDGLDQLDALRGDVGAVGHEVLHWDCGFQWAVREGDWKLHSADEGPHAEALRRTEHADVGVGSRLTHLGRDVGEETDWTSDYPEVVARLRARHDAWRAEVGIG